MVTRDTTVILLLACLIGGLDAEFHDKPEDIVVKMGGTATMNCRHSGQIVDATCTWTTPGGQRMLILIANPDPAKFQPYRKDNRDCGIQIRRVEESDNGKWECSALGSEEKLASTAEVNITVAVPPDNIKLYSGAIGGELEVMEDKEVNLRCEVQHARPEPAIYWYIDDDRIKSKIQSDIKNVDFHGFVDVTQNLTYRANPRDVGKDLKCVYFHEAYEGNNKNSSSVILNIQFAPLDRTYETLYKFVLGKTQDIAVNVSANPRPSVIWHMRGQITVAEGTSSQDGKYSASRLQNMGLGTWQAVMTVQNLGEADAGEGVEHLLQVQNELGDQTYRITISDLEAPPEVPLTMGAIAGIVIGILVLLIIVFVILYARYAGLWCFAAKGDQKQQSSSQAKIDTENPGLPAEGTENPTANHAQPDGSTEKIDHQTEAEPEINTDMNGKKDDKDTPV